MKRARELHVGVETLRLPVCTSFAVNDRQFGTLPDVRSAHDHDFRAYTWNYEAKTIGAWSLLCEAWGFSVLLPLQIIAMSIRW